MRRLAVLIALMGAAPALAHAPAAEAPAVAAPEPARLAAAKALIEVMMPAGKRDQMVRDMIQPTIGNVRAAMEQSPEIRQFVQNDPAMHQRLQQFIDGQMTSTMTMVTQSLPTLLDAMAIAYARRFTVDQLRDVHAFYTTPTGRVFVDGMPQVMADPAVLGAQRTMMVAAMGKVQASTRAFVEEMVALEQQRKPKP